MVLMHGGKGVCGLPRVPVSRRMYQRQRSLLLLRRRFILLEAQRKRPRSNRRRGGPLDLPGRHRILPRQGGLQVGGFVGQQQRGEETWLLLSLSVGFLRIARRRARNACHVYHERAVFCFRLVFLRSLLRVIREGLW